MEKYLVKAGKSDPVPDPESAKTAIGENECERTCELEPATLKKRKLSQKYVLSWENITEFQPWLKEVKNHPNYVAYCACCSSYLKVTGGKQDIIRHSTTTSHLNNSKRIEKNQTTMTCFIKPKNCSSMIVECRLAALIAEHNLSFNLADHLVKFIKNAFIDSKIAEEVCCGRTKTTAIVKNVLGASHCKHICEILKTTKFSICVDESTDISTTKLLTIVVRFPYNLKIQDYLFSLKKATAADAHSLYTAIVEVFNKENIDYKTNLIGYAADGASNMTGSNKSVATLLAKDCPNLFVLKCLCHSFALCSSYACMKLPSFLETMLRNIYNYISNSPKRTDQFEKIAVLLEIKPKRILHPSQTRWLSILPVVIRVLELYEPLKIFFGFARNVDEIENAKTIFNNLCSPITKLYLYFLKFILPFINKLTKVYQSEEPQIHKMYSDIQQLTLTICDFFLQPVFLKTLNLQTLKDEYRLPRNMLNLNEIYLGVEVQQEVEIAGLCDSEVNTFKNSCLEFYLELVRQILKRFDFNNHMVQSLSLINPRNIIDKKIQSFAVLYKHFSNLVPTALVQAADMEFRQIRNINFDEFDKKSDVIGFWKNVLGVKTAEGNFAYPILKDFIFNILSLPHSSANVERIFSAVNLNKTKIRNRLSTETVESLIFTKDLLRFNEANCYDLDISNQILSHFNSNMYI